MFRRIIKRDIYNRFGVLMVSAHTPVTKRELDLLIRHRITLQDGDLAVCASAKVETAMQELREVWEAIRTDGCVPAEHIRNDIVPVLNGLASHKELPYALSYLEHVDDYTLRHSICVSIVSRFIGRTQRLSAAELDELTIAALLHDVGKLKVPEHILTKSGKLTDAEFAAMKAHSAYGYDIVKGSEGCTHRQALVALQHHEREDGSGYPHRLTGERIDPFSKIVAVADVFHAMLSKRVYKDAMPLYRVLEELSDCAYRTLEPAITLDFVMRVMHALIGSKVELSNGQSGRIVMIKQGDPIRPVVEVKGDFIDLSAERSIKVERVQGEAI